MVIYETADKTIELQFPQKAFEKFKKEADVIDENKLTEKQIKKIYVLAVNAFLNGDISTDDIAGICNKMFYSVQALEDRLEPDLPDAMEAGSELGYYVRNPELLTQFNSFLRQVLSYKEEFSV